MKKFEENTIVEHEGEYFRRIENDEFIIWKIKNHCQFNKSLNQWTALLNEKLINCEQPVEEKLFKELNGY
jgi:hypothetical protein